LLDYLEYRDTFCSLGSTISTPYACFIVENKSWNNHWWSRCHNEY